MAELFAVPAAAVQVGCVVRVPDHVGLRAASLAEPLHTVLNGQEQAAARLRSGHRAGPDRDASCRSGPIRGAELVVGVDRLPERTTSAAAFLGPEGIRNLPADSATVREWSPRNGWDVVVVAAGAVAAVELAMDVVAPGGCVLAFGGMPIGRSTVPIDINLIHYKQLRLIGAFGGSPSRSVLPCAGWARSKLNLRIRV